MVRSLNACNPSTDQYASDFTSQSTQRSGLQNIRDKFYSKGKVSSASIARWIVSYICRGWSQGGRDQMRSHWRPRS